MHHICFFLLVAVMQSYFWQSQGEIRFMMLKRFMDVYYASVGTAIDTIHPSTWQLPLMTGAATFFYSLTGASQKASQAVNTGSRDLIQHAWYVVKSKKGLSPCSSIIIMYGWIFVCITIIY
jgi:hypothetical protein